MVHPNSFSAQQGELSNYDSQANQYTCENEGASNFNEINPVADTLKPNVTEPNDNCAQYVSNVNDIDQILQFPNTTTGANAHDEQEKKFTSAHKQEKEQHSKKKQLSHGPDDVQVITINLSQKRTAATAKEKIEPTKDITQSIKDAEQVQYK